MEPETKRKAVIYGTNFLTPSFFNFMSGLVDRPGLLGKVAGSANSLGALYFGALDLAGGISKKISDSRFTRMSKLVGTGFYGLQTIFDLLVVAGGEPSYLPFDASMALTLGMDTARNYETNDIVDDVRETFDSSKTLLEKLG